MAEPKSPFASLRQKAQQAVNEDDGIAPDLYAELPPALVLALVEVADAAMGVMHKSVDEDGLEWVSLLPGGQQRLWKALMAVGYDL